LPRRSIDDESFPDDAQIRTGFEGGGSKLPGCFIRIDAAGESYRLLAESHREFRVRPCRGNGNTDGNREESGRQKLSRAKNHRSMPGATVVQ